MNVHRRWNPLSRHWVLVSPQRTQRPWQGQQESIAEPAAVIHDPACYLCPRNSRVNGQINPNYTATFAFENDFAAMLPDPQPAVVDNGLLRAQPEAGICRVLCYGPNHSLSMSQMTIAQIVEVIGLWRHEFFTISQTPWVRNVQIFENRGEIMGASNPHPHGQLWANENLPSEIVTEAQSQQAYWETTGRSLLSAYVAEENASGERLVTSNDFFVALVPFWAVWPFEIIVVPRRHFGTIIDQTAEEDYALAEILQQVTSRFDDLFHTPFPYSFGLHSRPVNDEPHEGWHFHMHFYPPLLRSAKIRKFLVGYELLAQPQRDFTPETAALRLRDARPKP